MKLAQKNEKSLDEGTFFFRARILPPLEEKNNEIYATYFTEEQMDAPPSVQAREGRLNPVGISYLYLADDKETAVAETKPSIGARIQIGSYQLQKKIKVVNMCGGKDFLCKIGKSSYKEEEDLLWRVVQISFLIPIIPESVTQLAYLPSQYISEVFKYQGYEGVLFESVQRENGKNLVLFNSSNAKQENRNSAETIIAKIEYSDYISEAKKNLGLK